MAKHVCSSCATPLRYAFSQNGGGFVCHSCKLRVAGAAFLDSPLSYVWKDCNPLGQPIFVSYLGKLHVLSQKWPLAQIVGQLVADFAAPTHWHKLLAFAKEEHNAYGFSPIEFSLVRFERSVPEKARDFWLTLCVAYDLGNYLDDFQEAFKAAPAKPQGRKKARKAAPLEILEKPEEGAHGNPAPCPCCDRPALYLYDTKSLTHPRRCKNCCAHVCDH